MRLDEIAIVDERHSELSRRIAHAFLPPYFHRPQPIAERDIVSLMNGGRYTFVVDILPNFQRNVLHGRQPAIQLNVDATAMVQAGLGADYAQQIMMTEISDFLSRREGNPASPVKLVVRVAFNPNVTTAWFTSVMGIINSITMLAIILAGAAVVREPIRKPVHERDVPRPAPRGLGAGEVARVEVRPGGRDQLDLEAHLLEAGLHGLREQRPGAPRA